MTKRTTPTFKVGWLPNPHYYQGGCYCLQFANGHLFAEAATKGYNKGVQKRLTILAALWNSYAQGLRMVKP